MGHGSRIDQIAVFVEKLGKDLLFRSLSLDKGAQQRRRAGNGCRLMWRKSRAAESCALCASLAASLNIAHRGSASIAAAERRSESSNSPWRPKASAALECSWRCFSIAAKIGSGSAAASAGIVAAGSKAAPARMARRFRSRHRYLQ